MRIHRDCYVVIDGCNTQAVLEWSDLDPAAVKIAVLSPLEPEVNGWVEWVFARALLAEGMLTNYPQWVGIGDVRVCLGDFAHIHVELTGREGRAVLVLPWGDVSGFLEATFRSCPQGDAEGEVYEVAARVAVHRIFKDAA